MMENKKKFEFLIFLHFEVWRRGNGSVEGGREGVDGGIILERFSVGGC